MPVAKLDVGAIDKIVREAQRQAGAPVETLSLQSSTREWNVDMDGGEPDAFIANLDGGGLRLSGEPNPAGAGAGADSLLRAENLAKVIAAARKQAPADARVIGLDIRPDRVTLGLDAGGRTLALNYGYDAQLTNRTLSAKAGSRPPRSAGSRSTRRRSSGWPGPRTNCSRRSSATSNTSCSTSPSWARGSRRC
jgi:hypothetical protein